MTEKILKITKSICPECRQSVRAKVVAKSDNKNGGENEKIYLRKFCDIHGEQDSLISSDARFYYLSKGSDGATDCGTEYGCAQPAQGDRIGFLGRNATLEIKREDPSPFHKLSTCLALIEIVDSCNLACPTCFADSPTGSQAEQLKYYSFEDLTERIQGVLTRKGHIEILQLSGGEPTLHPQFFELLEWCHQNPGIDYVLVNSNGVRLAKEPGFGEQLRAHMDYGHFQFYLQYDGPGEAGEQELRGGDLRDLKLKAIERAEELQIPLTLAMTVILENLEQLWDTVTFGLQYTNIRGVSYQPMFGSGRVSGIQNQLNTADIILGLVEQAEGKLSFDDFTPLPCGDPNCATIGYLLKVDGETRSISDFVDFQTLQGFISDRVRYRLEDLEQCGCESEPLGQLLHQLELDESHTFRLFIKPFMDMDSWDQDRIDRCCTHVIRPDGALDSFCRYYLNGGATVYQPVHAKA